MFWLPFFWLVYLGYYGVWHLDCIPDPSGNLLYRVNIHKLEVTLGFSSWSEAYCGFCSSSLSIYLCVILMNLSEMDDSYGQVSFIVQDLDGHNGLGDLNS